MVSQPELYVDGTSRRDVIQGILGDCWLLSTCAALAKKEDLLHRVLAPDQPLYGPGYTGQLKVRLWQFGEWQEVIIDDFLPVLNGKYVYSHCDDPSEFWVAFIEKAFAKLYGSYEALEGGMPIESMVDLTGGLAERYQLSEWQMLETLYDYIRRSFSENAFITCSRKGDWRRAHASDVNGLVQGHAYTITGIYRLFVDNAMFCLVRIRNPWGDNNEWKGKRTKK
jgi:calpain